MLNCLYMTVAHPVFSIREQLAQSFSSDFWHDDDLDKKLKASSTLARCVLRMCVHTSAT